MKTRHNHSIVLICVFLLSLLFALSAIAEDTFRCGTKMVSRGDNKYQVLKKCGSPTYKEVRQETRIKRDLYQDLFPPPGYDSRSESEGYRQPLLVEEYVEIEEWTYDRGPNSLITTLIFENGTLVKVVTDGYGD